GAAVLPAVQPITPAAAQSGPPSTREVPARSIPVPETVSPQMQAIIARPFNPSFNLVPETTVDWNKRVEDAARNVVATLPRLREASPESLARVDHPIDATQRPWPSRSEPSRLASGGWWRRPSSKHSQQCHHRGVAIGDHALVQWVRSCHGS